MAAAVAAMQSARDAQAALHTTNFDGLATAVGRAEDVLAEAHGALMAAQAAQAELHKQVSSMVGQLEGAAAQAQQRASQAEARLQAKMQQMLAVVQPGM